MGDRNVSFGAQASRIRRFGGWIGRYHTPLALMISMVIVAGLVRQMRLLRTESVVVAPSFSAPLAPPPVEVPALERRSIDAARDLAWANDLVLVEVQVVAPGERRGKILDQFPLPGMHLHAGDVLTVTVSMGDADNRLPPDLRVNARTPLRMTEIPVDILQSRLARATARAAARQPTPEGD